MNRIDELFINKKNCILSIFFTAGYPYRDSTVEIIKELSSAGADMIEIGVPFSDPVADGPVIQNSGRAALKNGMSLKTLFRQLSGIRKESDIPLIIMSYYNPVMSYGVENFCKSCKKTGIDGAIIPDLTPEIYKKEYESLFQFHGLKNIMMISPQTRDKRIREIDRLSTGFIYMVSSSSTTGMRKGLTKEQIEYFDKVKKLKLKNPVLIGFGISNHRSYRLACANANGAIIGSGFIKMLDEWNMGRTSITDFIKGIKGD